MKCFLLKSVCSLAMVFALSLAVACGQPTSLNDPDLFQVPDIKTVAESQGVVRAIATKAQPLVKSPEDRMVFLGKMGEVFMSLGDKVIALAPEEGAVATGFGFKFQALDIRFTLSRTAENPDAEFATTKAALEALIAEAEKHPQAQVHVANARGKLFMERISQEMQKLDPENAEHRKILFLRLKPLFVEQVEKYPSPVLAQALELMMQLAEDDTNPAAADAAVRELINTFAHSPDTRLHTIAKTIAKNADGTRRRAIGKPFEIKGKTVAGDDLNWAKDYKGKIVLIDFWASWCGPCIAEVPNMIKAYEQFKGRGFEILSVGMSDTNEKLKKGMEDHKMSWVSLSEELTMKADEKAPKFGEYYGVQGIPTMFLVGRDGKIIVTDTKKIRGPNTLVKTLEEIVAKEEAEKKK